MLVKAIRTGWSGVQRHKVGGEPFDWPAGNPLPSWVEPVDPKDKAAVESANKARDRAAHAKLLREAMGQNASAAIEELRKSKEEHAALRKDFDDLQKQLAELQKDAKK